MNPIACNIGACRRDTFPVPLRTSLGTNATAGLLLPWRAKTADGGTDMRTFGWLLLVALLAAPLAARAQTDAVYQLGHFAFEDGGEIPDMKVGYVTWGKLNDARSNAILLVPGTSGNRHGYDAHIGPGKTFDTDKYFRHRRGPYRRRHIVLAEGRPRHRVPEIHHPRHGTRPARDGHQGLGITRLLAVGGGSMGSFQTVEWGINFPDAMSGLIMIVPAARSDHHFAAVVDAFEAMITLDPKYQGGKYTENPTEGIRRAALIYFPWTTSDDTWQRWTRPPTRPARKRPAMCG